jgi:CRISPR-associated endoribonuclease Cas6
MRLKIKLTDNTSPININNQHLVLSYLHKCLGVNNKYHDSKSNYCISNLRGGKLNDDKQTLSFNDSAFIVVTSLDNEFLGKLMCGLSMNSNFTCGMKYNGIEPLNDKIYDGYNIFRTLTPVLIKEYGTDRFITIDDDDYTKKLKEHIIRKFTKIDDKLDFSNFNLEIRNNKNHRTRMVKIKERMNFVSQFDVIIKSNKKIAELIYNYGLGQSTGAGFGTVYNKDNHSNYYNN